MSSTPKEGTITINGDSTIISFVQDFVDTADTNDADTIKIIKNMIGKNQHLFFEISKFNLTLNKVPGLDNNETRPKISYSVKIPPEYYVVNNNSLIDNENNRGILMEILDSESYTNKLLKFSHIGKFYKHQNDGNIKLVPTIYYLLGHGGEYWKSKSPQIMRGLSLIGRKTTNITFDTQKKFKDNTMIENENQKEEEQENSSTENVNGGRKKTKKRKSKKSKRRRKSNKRRTKRRRSKNRK